VFKESKQDFVRVVSTEIGRVNKYLIQLIVTNSITLTKEPQEIWL
jgi:hypothetical protein